MRGAKARRQLHQRSYHNRRDRADQSAIKPVFAFKAEALRSLHRFASYAERADRTSTLRIGII